jgi:hypothetical protein
MIFNKKKILIRKHLQWYRFLSGQRMPRREYGNHGIYGVWNFDKVIVHFIIISYKDKVAFFIRTGMTPTGWHGQR